MSLCLVIGSTGLVGSHLMQVASTNQFEMIGADLSNQCPHERLDIRKQEDVQLLIKKINPSVVCLPAALTNVDYCESFPKESYATNVLGVGNVVQATNEIGAKIVYFSSDYIFDGVAGPYRETDPANPINVYGQQKLAAEHYVAMHARDYLIIRTTVVYGWERQGKNFIYRLLNTLKANQILNVPADQIGNPTYAPNLAQVVFELICMDESGVYHVVGSERVSRYELACESARVFGLDENLIHGVRTSELAQAASRPLNAGMVTDKVSAIIKTPLVGYRDGLRMMALAIHATYSSEGPENH